jgi:hypothetical protein
MIASAIAGGKTANVIGCDEEHRCHAKDAYRLHAPLVGRGRTPVAYDQYLATCADDS